MSIDARVAAITLIAVESCDLCQGTGKDKNGWDDCPNCFGATKESPRVRLHLEGREEGDVPGQSTLTIVNPPAVGLEALVGIYIWGGANDIYIGGKKWASRIGYTKIMLEETDD